MKKKDPGTPFRRARPTLRLLREDLSSGWEDPGPVRCLESEDLSSLHPLPGLPHPIIAKAAESFSDNPEDDTSVGSIRCVHSIELKEIRSEQWRGGVWIDDQSICWLIVAGLAKGGHKDRDDFYESLERLEEHGGVSRLLPSGQDRRLWKREVASAELAAWDHSIQRAVTACLDAIHTGGTEIFSVPHPMSDVLDERDRIMAKVEVQIEPIRDSSYEADEIVVTVTPSSRWANSELTWNLTTRILISLSPPEQSWDRFQNTYSNIAEPGAFTRRLDALRSLNESGRLTESHPGDHAQDVIHSG